MSRLNPVINFLNELNSESMKSALGFLSKLLEDLEIKNDPEPIEMEIVSISYQLFENLNLLQAAMRKYQNSESDILTGSKLTDLYKGNKSSGSSSLFDD